MRQRPTPPPTVTPQGTFYFEGSTGTLSRKHQSRLLPPQEGYAVSTGTTSGANRFLLNDNRIALWLGLLLFTVLFSHCARPFQPLAMETRSYSQTASFPANASEDLQVTYDTFGILEVSNNRRYVKKAHKRNIKFLPVRLENTTSDTLTIDRPDLQVFGEYEAVATPSLEKLRYVRQVSWPYLLFLLFDFTVSNGGGDVDVRLTYFPIGTTYGISNFAVARVANRKFRRNMQQYATYPIAVPPGQTRYALLSVPANQPTNQLQIRYVASPR